MRNLKPILAVILGAAILLTFCACGPKDPVATEAAETTVATEGAKRELTAEEQALLQERRDIAEAHMRESVSILWRPTESLVYGLAARDNGTKLYIIEGRIYQGLPYAYAVGTQDSFLEYAGEPDEKGVYTISGLDATALNYESYGARVGNDCSGALTNAWSQIGTSFSTSMSSTMFEDYGVIPVGDYDFCPEISPETNRITDTGVVTVKNGALTMYTAYAQLQKADALFRQHPDGSNHTMMVVSTHLEYAGNLIDGTKSYVTVLEQTRKNLAQNVTADHPELGEKVYVIGGVDKVYTFAELFSSSYLPVTVKELVDPSPVEETWVKDSVDTPTLDNLFTGSITSNRYIDSVRITITNEAGEVIQEVTGRARRRYNKDFQIERLLTEKPGSVMGSIDLEALEPGSYRCKVSAKLTIEDNYEHILRDFDFTK